MGCYFSERRHAACTGVSAGALKLKFIIASSADHEKSGSASVIKPVVEFSPRPGKALKLLYSL